jgi:hypothetical protein
MGFAPRGPTGATVAVTNKLTDFGWEYVWHCHLLGHEENDMMRPIVFAAAPKASKSLAGTVAAAGRPARVNLKWTNQWTTPAATSMVVQRATNASFTQGLKTSRIGASRATLLDTSVSHVKWYYYRVRPENVAAVAPWSNTLRIKTR